eukprot:g3409.t1
MKGGSASSCSLKLFALEVALEVILWASCWGAVDCVVDLFATTSPASGASASGPAMEVQPTSTSTGGSAPGSGAAFADSKPAAVEVSNSDGSSTAPPVMSVMQVQRAGATGAFSAASLAAPAVGVAVVSGEVLVSKLLWRLVGYSGFFGFAVLMWYGSRASNGGVGRMLAQLPAASTKKASGKHSGEKVANFVLSVCFVAGSWGIFDTLVALFAGGEESSAELRWYAGCALLSTVCIAIHNTKYPSVILNRIGGQIEYR